MTEHTANTFTLAISEKGHKKDYKVVYESIPQTQGRSKPAVLFLHGLHSDRLGGKIETGKEWCAKNGIDFATLDYPCHGDSDGEFVDFTITHALEAATHLIESILKKPVVVVGSSTGGWLTLLLAKALPNKVKGIVSIANACDFTEELYWKPLPEAEQKDWEAKGYKAEPSWDGSEWHIGFELIRDGRTHLLMDKHLDKIKCPVRLLHGTADDAVPWQTSVQVAEQLGGDDVEVRIFPHANHRFSEPQNLDALRAALETLPVWE